MTDLREILIDRIAMKSSDEIHFKNQNRGEPEFGLDEKRQIVADLLTKSPSQFLYRFGLALTISDMNYFHQFENDCDVVYYIHHLGERLNIEHTKILIKNRRYTAIARLETYGYFDDLEMQRRDPLLYEEYVEKYLSDSEKSERLRAQNFRGPANSGQRPSHPFADLLMESLIEKPQVRGLRDQQKERSKNQEEELESDEERVEGPATTPLKEGEKEILRAEFRHIMEERFLNGHDTEFLNYKEVDEDTNLDVNTEAVRDEEDRYFDDEEPSNV